MKMRMIAAACMAAALAAGTAGAQSLGIGAGRQGSQNYAANAAMAKFLSDQLKMDVRVQAYGGSGQSMPLIDAGRLDLQLVPSPDFQAAAAGDPPFDKHPLKNLRAIASLGSSAYGFMVRKDSPYQKVADVKGKVITYGYAAQPTLKLQVDGILAAGGLSIKDMKTDNVPSVPNGVDDFMSGNADVAFFALEGGKTREADAQVGIRWLAVDDTPEAQKAMKKFVPTSYIKVVKKGAAPGVLTDTPMMSYDYVLVAGKSVPDDVVTKIVTILHDHPDQVRTAYKTFASFDPKEMAPDLGDLQYHEAATKYYKTHGLME